MVMDHYDSIQNQPLVVTIEVKKKYGKLWGYPAEGDVVAAHLLELMGGKAFTPAHMPILEKLLANFGARLEQHGIGLGATDQMRWKSKRDAATAANLPVDANRQPD